MCYTWPMNQRATGSDAAGHRVPKEHFASGTWPDGAPEWGAPLAVVHAAVLASELLLEVPAEHGSMNARLALLSEKTGVPKGTLRGLVEGTRWPRLDVVATLECALERPLTGWYLVLQRLHRQSK